MIRQEELAAQGAAAGGLRSLWHDLLAALQFLTRIPVPAPPYDEGSLARSVKFFPLVGLLIGALASLLHALTTPHLNRNVCAVLVISLLILITGGLHEDGLADAADGFGGGWQREQVLAIFKDSRIGSYGGAALGMNLLARVCLIASLPLDHFAAYLIVAQVLCRWTTLPLSHVMGDARAGAEGLGSPIARLTTRGTLLFGTSVSFAIAIFALRWQAAAPILAALAVTVLSGLYYRHRIQGVTGDCFGATNQLTEIAVYLCGAWVR